MLTAAMHERASRSRTARRWGYFESRIHLRRKVVVDAADVGCSLAAAEAA